MNRATELPIGVLAAATMVALMPLAMLMRHAVASLDASRSVLADLHSEARALDPHERVTAQAHLVTFMRETARSRGVRLGQLALTANPEAGLATVHLDVSGSQPAVLAFADALETGPHALRFQSWKLQRIDNGVRLTADGVTLLRLWR